MYIRYVFKLGLLVLFSAAVVCLFTACSEQQVNKSELVISTTALNIDKPQADTSEEKEHTDPASHKSFGSGITETYVVLNSEGTVINGDGVSFKNNVLTVTKGGNYYLSGQLTNGRICVSSTDVKKPVRLHLDGVTVSCDEGAPLLIADSPLQTVIVLYDDTVNSFSDMADKKAEEGSTDTASVIHCEDELQIEGEGVLDISAELGKGIYSQKSISILDGYIHIDAPQHSGIDCDSSVSMTDGTVVVFGSPNENESAISCDGKFNVSDGTLLVAGNNVGAQSVTGTDEVNVLTYTLDKNEKGLGVIAEQDGEVVAGFKAPEGFSRILLASEELESDETYSLYKGGSIAGEEYKGVYFDAQYKAGTLVGVLS